jgi:hypothetical protein
VRNISDYLTNLFSYAALFLTQLRGRLNMSQGDKDKYTAKQKREAHHIEEGYEERGVSEKEAARRAWATVNKMHGGGGKGGSGTAKIKDPSPAIKGGKKGGKAAAQRPTSSGTLCIC